jgi:benzodiazapine receptor
MKKSVRKKERINLKTLIFCLIIVYAVAAVGSIITTNDANINWYNSATTPLAPPNFVFMIVWNVLFFLIALSLYFSWNSGKKQDKIKLALIFGINFVLNMLWSILFFGLKKPNLAFFELIIFWISIIAMIFTTWKIDKKSAWLLAPYFLWVSFAGVLNYLIAFPAALV